MPPDSHGRIVRCGNQLTDFETTKFDECLELHLIGLSPRLFHDHQGK